MKTIAYQGVEGAFSYLTALKTLGEANHFRGVQTFKEVFELVKWGLADCGVIPIENSLVGSIYENYDLLNVYEMQIVGEHYTKIEHCLLAILGDLNLKVEERLKTIKKVISHPKALEQCSAFFQEHPWIESVVYANTAAAAAEIARKGDSAWAAIASVHAGKLYGLEILKKNLEDDPKNYTRFVTIMKKKMDHGQTDKCSLLIELKHVPGALAEMLKQFADQAINLTKIESRPLRGSPFEYLFYVDFEYPGKKRQDVERLLKGLCSKVQKIKILGFYKRGING